MIKPLFLLFIALFLLNGCSYLNGDNKVNKAPSNGMSPKELYELAEIKIKEGSTEQAITQYKIILGSYPSSKYAVQASLDIAYNLYKNKKYNRSIIQLNSFIKKYPSINSTSYAYYLRGIVAQEKSASILDDLITDVAQRDVQSIKEAYGYFIQLIDTFPDSKYSEDASDRLNILTNILARHELYVSLYYTNNQSNIAAINRSKYIIENYPSSPSVPDSIHLMAFNYEQIGAKKLAEDARIILKSTYPNFIPNYTLDL